MSKGAKASLSFACRARQTVDFGECGHTTAENVEQKMASRGYVRLLAEFHLPFCDDIRENILPKVPVLATRFS